MTKAMIVMNPSSGHEQADSYVDDLKNKVTDWFDNVQVRVSQKEGEVFHFAEEAGRHSFDALFVIGGDGTVHQAINAIAPYPDRPCLGIIPTGTVNNFARALGISKAPEEAIAQMSFTQMRNVDVGKVNDTYFVSTVAAGSIPQSVQQVDAAAKTKFGPFAYLFEGAKALNDDSAPRFELTLDDKPLAEQFSMILVAVTHSVAGIETFFPSARPDDGKLHFMGLRETSTLEKLSLVPEIFKADQEDSEHLVIASFEKGHLTAPTDDSLVCTIDGETGPRFPIDVSVLPRFLRVFSPTS